MTSSLFHSDDVSLLRHITFFSIFPIQLCTCSQTDTQMYVRNRERYAPLLSPDLFVPFLKRIIKFIR